MAKKKKNALFNNVMEVVATENTSTTVDVANEIKENDDIVNAVVKEAPVQYDDVNTASDELIRLSNENSELTDKLAEYIDEIKSLKEEIQNLTDENDKHLMKIAELSFENATLQASLKNLENSKNTENNIMPQHSMNVNYPKQNNIFANRSGLNTGDYWN